MNRDPDRIPLGKRLPADHTPLHQISPTFRDHPNLILSDREVQHDLVLTQPDQEVQLDTFLVLGLDLP